MEKHSHEAALKTTATKIEEFQKGLEKMAKDKKVEELFAIIKRPGWTTPAELFLCQNILDSLNAQLNQLQHNVGQLVEGAGMVGQ